MNEKELLHERLKMMVEFAPTIKNLFTTDVGLTISDHEKIILQIDSKEIPVGNNRGRVLTKDDPMYEVLRDNKRVAVQLPKEAYGFAFRTIITPITDENNKVIGSIAVTYSLDNQENLVQVAEQLAASSEEISASTSEMSYSANDMKGYMDNLTEQYNEMNTQMKQTDEILELINSIAQSSRILGLNAGIEAARSGEYGKGFSVVAQEITKLAARSAESVDQIRKLLNSVKEKVDHVSNTVNQTVVISNHQLAAINEISEAIQHLTVVAADVEEMARKI